MYNKEIKYLVEDVNGILEDIKNHQNEFLSANVNWASFKLHNIEKVESYSFTGAFCGSFWRLIIEEADPVNGELTKKIEEELVKRGWLKEQILISFEW